MPTTLVVPIQDAFLYLPMTLNYMEETLINKNNIFYQPSPSNIKIVIKKFFKQQQLILTQLIIVHAASGSPILGFM